MTTFHDLLTVHTTFTGPVGYLQICSSRLTGRVKNVYLAPYIGAMFTEIPSDMFHEVMEQTSPEAAMAVLRRSA